MQEIVLEGMTEDEALNILHSQCEAEFDENELDPDTTGSLNERIKQEPAFKDCKNLVQYGRFFYFQRPQKNVGIVNGCLD